MSQKKKKVLLLSDHALCTSGVGVQSRHLIEGLLKKYPGEWSFRQYGAAIRHNNYDVVVVNEDFVIKPIDGFGNPDLLRVTLATEKPDVLMIFTDPRFFTWLFEMEEEVHQVCPIAWWHVWDNRPTPQYNNVLYESTDLINCHSYLTYEMCSENFPEKTNFIPHALPGDIFKPISESDISKYKNELLGPDRADHFVALWINRNARRKRPADLLWAWSIFVEQVEKKYGKKDVTLLMHTDPQDVEGPNL
ncbi:MAG: glycosyltransferase family 4 protein, partial [Nitrospinae bacterium]|nr:glycosyltransferase family 4 protein [Nitrospinota bacterium]